MPRPKIALFVLLWTLPLLAGCAAPQSNDDTLQQRYAQTQATNQKLESENQALQAQLQQNQQNQQNTYTISADMLFAPHGLILSASGQTALNDIVTRLRGLKNGKIVVYGYTDDEKVGPPLKKLGINSNMELSSKRADVVADYLRAHGVNPALISAKGRAETHPVAPDDSPAGRAKNRRVEIVVEGPGS